MTYSDNIFTKIINREMDVPLVFEDDDVAAFHDIAPQAPVHVLVIPKQRVVNLIDASDSVLAKLLCGVKRVASKLGLDEGGYRVVINNGSGVGQSVFHLHVHILSGRSFSWPPG
jgi:histidine triad (HIT) family protein